MRSIPEHASQRRRGLDPTRLRHEQRGAGACDSENVQLVATIGAQDRGNARGGRWQHRGDRAHQGGAGLVAGGDERDTRA